MQEKTPNEFRRGDPHRFLLIVVLAIVLVAKSHVSISDVDQSRIGNRDAVRVPTDVVQDLLGAGERRFGIDYPLGVPRWRQVSNKTCRWWSGSSNAKNWSAPLSNAASSAVTNRRRNRRDSTRTGKKKPGRQEIH
jgi:hypothetical protein